MMKARIGKKVLSLFLSLLLLLGLMPVTVFAAEGTTAEGLYYEIKGESVTIIWYEGTAEEVVIPATIEGKPVTAIGDYAFYYLYPRRITFAEGSQITSIGDYAFAGCVNLENIDIPDNVTTIGYCAFFQCTSLNSVIFPDGRKLTTIDDGAFADCENLKNIDIPAGVTSIGIGAFQYCTSLTDIEIPASVTSIGAYAFDRCTNLSSVTFAGKNAPSLGEYVFDNCPALTNIYVPHGAAGYTAENGWPENFVNTTTPHTLNHHDAVAPTCTEDGTKEYWYCLDCGGYFLDKDGEIETDEAGIIEKKATGHDWGEPVWNWSDDGKTATATFTCKNDNSHVETREADVTQEVKSPATCTEKGAGVYTAAVTLDGNEYTDTKNVETAPLGHKAEKVDGNAPTATEPGNIEYWYCPQCDTYFEDADLTEAITKEQTVLSPTGKLEEETNESPQTGDDSNTALWLAVMLTAGAALTGTLLYNRKKKYSK